MSNTNEKVNFGKQEKSKSTANLQNLIGEKKEELERRTYLLGKKHIRALEYNKLLNEEDLSETVRLAIEKYIDKDIWDMVEKDLDKK